MHACQGGGPEIVPCHASIMHHAYGQLHCIPAPQVDVQGFNQVIGVKKLDHTSPISPVEV